MRLLEIELVVLLHYGQGPNLIAMFVQRVLPGAFPLIRMYPRDDSFVEGGIRHYKIPKKTY